LEALKLSHPKITVVLEKGATFGFHGKLTGAGGGGFVYLLIPPHIHCEKVTELINHLEELDMNCYQTTLGTEGVQIKYVS